LQDRAKTNLGDLERVQEEVNDYRKQVTTLEMELESLRGSVSMCTRGVARKKLRSGWWGNFSILEAFVIYFCTWCW